MIKSTTYQLLQRVLEHSFGVAIHETSSELVHERKELVRSDRRKQISQHYAQVVAVKVGEPE